ncbi:hypothetical protein D3C71_1907850 [compost metagenome]
MQFTRLGVGGVPAAEVGQAQGDMGFTRRVIRNAILNAQREGGTIGAQARPVTFLGRPLAAGGAGRDEGGDVEAGGQISEGAPDSDRFRQIKQGGRGRVQMMHLAECVQRHHRH